MNYCDYYNYDDDDYYYCYKMSVPTVSDRDTTKVHCKSTAASRQTGLSEFRILDKPINKKYQNAGAV